MLKMRTIDQLAAYIRELDPDTALTKTALRRLVISGQIPCRKIGQKYIVSIEAVTDYLAETPKKEAQSPQVVGIRPVQ